MSKWTARQIQAMEALGIPFLAGDSQVFAEPAERAVADEASSAPSSEPVSQPQAEPTPVAEDSTYYYKLGPWILSFAEELPVQRFTWLNDLAASVDDAPSLVSSAGEQQALIDANPYAKDVLTPQQKRELWALLKPWLS